MLRHMGILWADLHEEKGKEESARLRRGMDQEYINGPKEVGGDTGEVRLGR